MSDGTQNTSSGNTHGDPSCLPNDSDTENAHFNKDTESCETPSVSQDGKLTLKIKLKEILSCRVCLELRRSTMYQCKFGHLICAGCFGDLIAEGRIQNEIASCPTCQTAITKELCSRNVAVEKTISELPMTCPYCSLEFPPDVFKKHETELCDKRPVFCSNHLIGCLWQGPSSEKVNHEDQCMQPTASGYDILKSLMILDKKQKGKKATYEKIIELLSVEKIAYNDLQFKLSSNDIKNVIFETTKFSAFENHWIVRSWCHKESSELCYQLVLETKPSSPLCIHYLIIKGPYSDMEIKPRVDQFKFTDKATEAPYKFLKFTTEANYQKFLSAKRNNFRIFMFSSR